MIKRKRPGINISWLIEMRLDQIPITQKTPAPHDPAFNLHDEMLEAARYQEQLRQEEEQFLEFYEKLKPALDAIEERKRQYAQLYADYKSALEDNIRAHIEFSKQTGEIVKHTDLIRRKSTKYEYDDKPIFNLVKENQIEELIRRKEELDKAKLRNLILKGEIPPALREHITVIEDVEDVSITPKLFHLIAIDKHEE